MDAFKRRHERGEPQAVVEELEVSGCGELEDDPLVLRELLLLPCFGRLQALDCFVNPIFTDEMPHLETLAAYMVHTDGAPCLRRVRFPSFGTSPSLRLAFQTLFSGGLVNLISLSFYEVVGRDLEQLGSIYRAGGLAKLEKLALDDATIGEQSMGVWMQGVLASGHRGAALRELSNKHGVKATTGARLVFVDALKEGAFPNVEELWMDGEIVHDYFFQGDEVVQAAFLAAMARGAPCARTLRAVALGEMTPDQFKAYRKALPRISDWRFLVDVVESNMLC